jgi:hypothetical protein
LSQSPNDSEPPTGTPRGEPPADLVALDTARPVWDRFFTVAPLVVIGTREPDGGYDLAPKHMVTPPLAYIAPGRFCNVERGESFPFPSGFRRGDEAT